MCSGAVTLIGPVQDLLTWGLFIVHPKEQTSPQLLSVVFLEPVADWGGAHSGGL